MFIHISKQMYRTVPTGNCKLLRKLLNLHSQNPITKPYQSTQRNGGGLQLHRRFETSEVRLGIKVKGRTYTPTPLTKGPQQLSSRGPGGKVRGGTSNDGTANGKYNHSE